MVAKKEPDFKPGIIQVTGGNIMVSGSVLILAVTLAISAVKFQNSFENRMTVLELQLKGMRDFRWDLPRQREWHNQVWRDNPALKMDESQPDKIANRIQ